MAARPYSAVSLLDTRLASLPSTRVPGPVSLSVFHGADQGTP